MGRGAEPRGAASYTRTVSRPRAGLRGEIPASLLRADVAVYRAIRSRAVLPLAVRAARGMSVAGEHAAVWLALGGAGAVTAADLERRSEWARAALAVGGAHALNVLLKRIVRRPRPLLEGLPALSKTASAMSFPSAHTTSSFAGARAYSAFLPAPPLYAAAGAMALSRVFLGVHYPSDVLAGALLGTAVGSLGRPSGATIPPVP